MANQSSGNIIQVQDKRTAVVLKRYAQQLSYRVGIYLHDKRSACIWMNAGTLALPGLVEALGKDPCIVGGRFGDGLTDGPAQLYTVGRHAVHPGTAYYVVYDALGFSVKAKRQYT